MFESNRGQRQMYNVFDALLRGIKDAAVMLGFVWAGEALTQFGERPMHPVCQHPRGLALRLDTTRRRLSTAPFSCAPLVDRGTA
jgi:hypothetical protein